MQLDRGCMHGFRRKQVRHHDATVAGTTGELRRMDTVNEHEAGCRFFDMKSLDVSAL